MKVQEVEYEIPSLGPVLLVSKKCLKCGFRRNDILPLRRSRRTRLYLRVETPEDYRTKVVRSPYAQVIIPELGMCMRPGATAQVFITNVEGILQIFLDTLLSYEVLEGVKVEYLKKRLQDILNGQKVPLTVILDDAEGLSAFILEPGAHPLLAIELVS